MGYRRGIVPINKISVNSIIARVKGGPLESLQSLAGRPVPVASAASREPFSGTTVAGMAGVMEDPGLRKSHAAVPHAHRRHGPRLAQNPLRGRFAA